MILNPRKMVEEGVIKVDNPHEQIQQNGVDLTVSKIFRILPDGNILTKTGRRHAQRREIVFDETGKVLLTPGQYDIEYGEEFNLPNGISAAVYSRSTLNRGGNYLTSGYFDAGFKGKGGGCLHVTVGTLVLEKGVRIGQMVFIKSEEGDLYDGVYNEKTTVG